jgi:uncharacterized protein (DUF1499 family)
MARFFYLFVLAIIAIAVALVIAGRLGMLRGHAPSDLGVKDGKLKAMQRIASALQALPRTIVINQTSDYIYAQSSTALMQYTDDVEFWRDSAAGVVHVRSASRIGRKDFGVNRERVEQIRKAIGP